jgi:hypothetical protein
VSGGDEFLVVSPTTYLTFSRHPEKEGLGDITSADIDNEGILTNSFFSNSIWLILLSAMSYG